MNEWLVEEHLGFREACEGGLQFSLQLRLCVLGPSWGWHGRRKATYQIGAAHQRERDSDKVGQRFCAGCMTGDLAKLCFPRSVFDSVFNNNSYLWSALVGGLDFLGNNNAVLLLVASTVDKGVSLCNICMI